MIFTFLRTYLLDDILFKVDRASMYTSLEVRAPFLDVEVVELINSLPDGYKRKGLSGKRLLKQVMRGKLPDSIIDRPKKGFGIPLSGWLRHELRPLCEELLSETTHPQATGSSTRPRCARMQGRAHDRSCEPSQEALDADGVPALEGGPRLRRP